MDIRSKQSEVLSNVARSNIFTMGVAAKKDHRQKLTQEPYSLPDEAQRRLAAQLILEEALETINALGFLVFPRNSITHGRTVEPDYELTAHTGSDPVDVPDIIDGACDLIYVATGAILRCGAPDLPHLDEVCRANNDKFPGGVAITNPDTGKYLKPEGWCPPDHVAVARKWGW